MICPQCGGVDQVELAAHSANNETIHVLACGHDVTADESRAFVAAQEAQGESNGESASGVPEGAAVDSQEGGSVGEGGGSDPGVADTQSQPGGQEGEPEPAQGEVAEPAPAAPAEATPEASMLQKVEGEIEHFLHPDQAAN